MSAIPRGGALRWPRRFYRFVRQSWGLIVLIAVTTGCTADVAWQIYVVACSSSWVTQRALRSYEQIALANLATAFERETRHLTDATLWPAAVAHAANPRAILRDAWYPERDEQIGLRPELSFCADANGDFFVDGDERSALPAERRWIRQMAEAVRTPQALRSQPTSLLVPAVVGGRDLAIALLVISEASGPRASVYGYVIDRWPALTAIASAAYAAGALIPTDAGTPPANDSTVAISVRATNGLTKAAGLVFASRRFDAARRSVSGTVASPLGPLRLSIQLSPRFVAAQTAAKLGWDRAQLIIGLLTVTTGLLVATILQIRRHRALARVRNDFVANVSHELRTPLAQIRLFAEMLRLGWLRSDGERERAITVIDQEVRRLSGLVENALIFSRMRRGPLTIAESAVDVGETVRYAVSAYEPLAAARQVRMTVEITGGLFVRAARDSLHQVITNLLDNAVKYGPPGQTVRVVGRPVDGGRLVHLSVIDQGPGIPLAARRRIWDAYERLEADRETTGHGLGLAVVRSIVEAHGGHVSVGDAWSGGAEFAIVLPVAEPVGQTFGPSPGAGNSPFEAINTCQRAPNAGPH